ncbi:MAG TPA: F-box protein [Alphaproteobacteria bacterium]|nr:F-box protein [Alphaproteobacteria bacterium]
MTKSLFSALMIGTSILAFSMPLVAMEEDKLESSKATCLMDLPSELHMEIARKCSLAALGRLALVSHYWKNISEENYIWRNIAEENGLSLPNEDLGFGKAKSKVKEEKALSTVVTTIENGTKSPLRMTPAVDIFYGPSIDEINNWRVHQKPSTLVSAIKAKKQLPHSEIDSGKKLVVEWNTIQEHFDLPQAQAYTGDISMVFVSTAVGKGLMTTTIYNEKMTTDPLKYNNKRNAYKIKTSTDPRKPYTLELIN